jgi:hypothetical protein
VENGAASSVNLKSGESFSLASGMRGRYGSGIVLGEAETDLFVQRSVDEGFFGV